MNKTAIIIALILSYPLSGMASEHKVGQKNKSFSTDTLSIKTGDTVHFTNQDPFFHNIFSLSDTKSFDLGSYPRGQHRSVTFDEPGAVEIECAIHPNMQMTIEIDE